MKGRFLEKQLQNETGNRKHHGAVFKSNVLPLMFILHIWVFEAQGRNV